MSYSSFYQQYYQMNLYTYVKTGNSRHYGYLRFSAVVYMFLRTNTAPEPEAQRPLSSDPDDPLISVNKLDPTFFKLLLLTLFVCLFLNR